MAKALRIEAICDGPHEGEVRATVERTLGVNGVWRVVDLCESCDGRFVLPVRALMDNGVEPENDPTVKRRTRKRGAKT